MISHCPADALTLVFCLCATGGSQPCAPVRAKSRRRCCLGLPALTLLLAMAAFALARGCGIATVVVASGAPGALTVEETVSDAVLRALDVLEWLSRLARTSHSALLGASDTGSLGAVHPV